MERMGYEKLAMIAGAEKVERKKRGRRPKLRWGIALKRHRKLVGEEWRQWATDRRNLATAIEKKV